MPNPIYYVNGSLEQEARFDLRELLPEECGLAAAINVPDASYYVYDCLVLQEHRGEDSVGIISCKDQRFYMRRRVGVVREQFLGYNFAKNLPGSAAIGHTRYATRGDVESISNIQPLFFYDSRFGPFSIAHNGTLLKCDEIRKYLTKKGVLFQSTMDSELLAHAIVRSTKEPLVDAIIDATSKIPAAYSLLLFTQDKLVALRDKFGVRPLSIGAIDGGHLVCSENYTFDQYSNCEHVGDINPGEMVIFERGKKGFQRIQYVEPQEQFCVFEGIYFSDPRSRYNGIYHETFRYELGRQIFKENPDLRGDNIVPILDSGKHAAIGLAEASGILYREYFKRLHNPPRAKRRSFTSPNDEERIRTAYQKLHLRQEKIKGKHIVTVDDSIVRSTTTRIINQRLREAGAASITNCISSPPIVDVCLAGMDFQQKSELIAAANSIAEIQDLIKSDRLIYLSLPGLNQVVANTYNCNTCTGCFNGCYAS